MSDFQDLMNQYAAERREHSRQFVEHWRRIDEDAKPLIVALAAQGLKIRSTGSLLTKGILFDPPIVDILLRSLKTLQIDNNKDMVVRALILAKEPFDGRPLIECFENHIGTTSLRWVIGNTMACAKITGIADWLIPAIQNSAYGDDRQMLTMAIVKHVPIERARQVLLSVFDELPTHVATALGSIGGPAELAAIRSRIDSTTGPLKKKFVSSARKIEKRLEKQSKRKK